MNIPICPKCGEEARSCDHHDDHVWYCADCNLDHDNDE